MKEVKNDRRSRYTIMVLQESLIELMKQKPITKISITELCKNADVNRTTFYSHFADQFELLASIEEKSLSWARGMIDSLNDRTGRDERLQILANIFEYLVQNSNHLQVLMSDKGDIDFQKKIVHLVFEQCGLAQDNMNSSDMETKKYYFVFVINGSIGIIQSWLSDGMKKPPYEMAEIILNMTEQIQYWGGKQKNR